MRSALAWLAFRLPLPGIWPDRLGLWILFYPNAQLFHDKPTAWYPDDARP